MKKTIAVIGSAAVLSFAGAGLAAADDDLTGQEQNPGATQEDTIKDETDDTETPEVTPELVSEVAEQLCGTISAYDFLGSAEGIVPGLSGDECKANADEAVAAAMTGDIKGALDIIRGIDAGTPGDGEDAGENGDAAGGSAQLLGSLNGGGDATEDPTEDPQAAAFGS